MSPAAACLGVLCGLPAAGKSRLARELRGTQTRGWRTLLVTYDELIPARDWQECEWKQHRKTVLMCLERFLHQTLSDQTHTLSDQTQTHTLSDQTHTLSDQTRTLSDQTQTLTLSDQTQTLTLSEADGVWMRFEQMRQQQSVSHTHSQPLVVLLDDNFYYQSMRYQIQQLARKYGVGFCQVFLQCPLHVCLQRNRCRSQPVPDDVLLQMCERMEPPNEIRNPWEQQSLTLDSTDGIADGHVQKLMDVLASALENPLSPVQDESQQKEADRRICASSVLHQADQTCRRLVSQALTSAHGQASPDVLKALAKALNELKTVFLQELKKDVLHRVSVFPEELLMDVSAAFQRHSHEIVSKHVKHD
ncbi:L-seryl-tRNA(Sec) kinase [Sinocyclocheilus anshuiensis]|uniref:L-seryl-tRNA(Sec) kinase n=1 Tax=Sinocyclocheilus anshuiensis TaxID=1608454 RepID=A0A671N986_9TELE|nr:PREDICTED: L-seryl-tRNA(Sec) kinase [Sinocyclocheilus anshuiensis]